MVYFCTYGFSYNDWVGNFYPISMPRREWFSYYAREFNTCEVNSTYYALPGLSSVKAMIERTNEDFLLSIKANQEMTHRLSSPAITGVGKQSVPFANSA